MNAYDSLRALLIRGPGLEANEPSGDDSSNTSATNSYAEWYRRAEDLL